MPSLVCHIITILVVVLAVTLRLLPQLVYPPDTLSFFLDESVANDGTTRNVIVTGANSGLGLVSIQFGL
jgi:NADPH:quinone reductase-like Zn-dependent oxidoreductase